MAMRIKRKEVIVPLKPKEGFHITIPPSLLEGDSTRDHVLLLWRDFAKSASIMCQARHNRLMSKTHRKAVFVTQMGKLCGEFSRRTENLKVSFQVVPRKGTTRPSDNKVDYQLKFKQLTDIPEESRNAPWCTADIPQPLVTGRYVSPHQRVAPNRVVVPTEQHCISTEEVIIPTAPAIEFSQQQQQQQSVPTIYIRPDYNRAYGNTNQSATTTTVVATDVVPMAITPCASVDDSDNIPVIAAARC